jgi:DNA invertase Pin-like site-specific DNA recombinase
MTTPKRAIAYARYSTSKQSARSIDDQFELCEKIAKQHGYEIVGRFQDAAKHGAGTLGREGWQALMRAVANKNRDFDAVIIENLSRMSRDLADSARDFKRIAYRQVELIDLEGPLNTLRVGLSGVMNQEFRKHLGNMMRRAWDGRVKDGLMPGKPAYGHRKVPGTSFEREPDPETAKVVHRIFTMFADRVSVRDMAAQLNREGIKSPTGGVWNHNIFTAGCGNGKGIIGNRIFIGELVWNANRSVIDPDKETRVRQKGNPNDLLVVQVPHLRTIEQDLWDRAQKVRAERSRQTFAVRNSKKTIERHMLADKLVCGVCGGPMRIVWSRAGENARVGCMNAQKRGICINEKTYSLSEIEATVLHGIKHDLDVEALMAFTEGAHSEYTARQRAASIERATTERELNRVIEKIDRITSAIADTDGEIKPLVEKLKTLEWERAGLASKLELAQADGNVVTLLPVTIQKFRTDLEAMHAALTDVTLSSDRAAPFRVAFSNTFEKVVVHQTGKRKPVEVTPYARLSAIMGVDIMPKLRTAKEVLENHGLTNCVSPIQATLEQLGW